MAAAGPNVAAVIEEKCGRLQIQKRAVPVPGPGEMVVRNRAIAANPVDWKIQEYGIFVEKYPSVLGSDVAGEVTAVGSDVSHFAVGDRAAGFSGLIYNNNIDHGAWQTYTVLPELGSFKVPAHISFEQAAVLPMGMATAAMALFVELGIPRTPHPSDSNEALLVWGAASSVGASAVQVAHDFGWKVFATASPKHHAWIKEVGATAVFDYSDPQVVAKIAAAVKAQGLVLCKALDPVSETSTFDFVCEALKATGGDGGTIATVLEWPKDKPKPEGIKAALTLAFRHATDQTEIGRWFFNEWLEKALASGSVKPAPEFEVVDGGVQAAQKVFDLLKAGVSGKKLVVQVA